jgi:hypothetical protein
MGKRTVNSGVSAKRAIKTEKPDVSSRHSRAKTERCASPKNRRSYVGEPTVLTAATYLDELNPEQRRAVEHGVSRDRAVGPPLLVIAGAGSGKTNTLAIGSRISSSEAQTRGASC